MTRYWFSIGLQAQSRLNHLAPVVQKVNNAIHRINHYSLDSAIGVASVYPADSAIHRLSNRGLKISEASLFARFL